MPRHLTSSPLKVAVTRDGSAEDGLSIFADEVLVAIVTLLGRTAPDESRGGWYLEAGFGPCEVAPASKPIFLSPDDARDWVLGRLA